MNDNLSEFGFLRIASVSPELRIADPVFNAKKIIEVIDIANTKKCNFIVFPEMSLTGFSCGDLFFQTALRTKTYSAIDMLCRHTGKTASTIIVGAPIAESGILFNTAIVISNGKVLGVIPKSNMSNSNEFYEERWFSSEYDRTAETILINDEYVPFGADILFDIANMDYCYFGVEICEDLWTVKPPSLDMAAAGANIIVNLSAGNEILGKAQYRRQLVCSQSARCLGAYIYSGAGPWESSTDIVFSGHSMIAENGKMLAETDRFSFDTEMIIADLDIECLNNDRLRNNSFGATNPDKEYRIIEVDLPDLISIELLRKLPHNPFVPEDETLLAESCSEIFNIQTTGLIRRMKQINCKDVVIGLSGGLDSTLALLVCINAFEKAGLGLEGIHAITMPGFGTSSRTKNNALKLAKLVGAEIQTISIEKAVKQHFKDIGHDADIKDVVFENSQARERTQILMDYANKINGMVIGTGDLSELALGWCTFNGDHMSNYAVNSGVPKTLIKEIVKWYAAERKSGEATGKKITETLLDICNTPISPELLPIDKNDNIQDTEKSIGPYALHDFFLYYMHRHNFSPSKIYFLALHTFNKKYNSEDILKYLKLFYRRFFSQQFKRSCMPDGIKTGSIDLSPRGDWRMPSDASVNIWLNDLDNINTK